MNKYTIEGIPQPFINKVLTRNQRQLLRLKWNVYNDLKAHKGKRYPVENLSDKYNIGIERMYTIIRQVKSYDKK